MIRSAANRLARRYDRQSLRADFCELYNNDIDAARTWVNASRKEVIAEIEALLALNFVQGELRIRFSSCLIAERYLRRTDRMQVRTERLSREEIEAKLFLDDIGIGFERESAA